MSRDNQKRRTRRALVEAAARLMLAGKRPSVAEVADAAEVSRRTAYRYFPSAEQLAVEAALEALRPGMELSIDAGAADQGIDGRVDRLVDALHRLTLDNEPLLRQMIRFTVDRGPIEPGVPPRPRRRLEYIEHTLAPLRAHLAKKDFDRLVNALAVVIGIEATLVLRDICGLDSNEIVKVEHWAAQALLSAATNSAEQRKHPRHRPPVLTQDPATRERGSRPW
ncbi:MAG TPA: TetR/AcrR family transcriptional regulator [Acidimicrobiales bacterium]|nr:TetR/AcrR family transcriptional regulator [Acidimicrobiales bacterium]